MRKIKQTERERIGQLLHTLRIEQGRTIRDLAEASGLSKTTIVNVEAGRFSVTIDVIATIAYELDSYITISKMARGQGMQPTRETI